MYEKLAGISEKMYEILKPSYIGEFYKKHLNEFDIVWDVGAWKGLLTKWFLEDNFKVVAIEGAPSNHADLFENVGGHPNCDIVVQAVNDSAYEVRTRFNDCNGSEHPEQDISYTTLDSIYEVLGKPDFVKMDIEGMESVALKAADKVLAARPIWQLSLHENHGWRYSDYPGWRSLECGGFDFSYFYKDHLIINCATGQPVGSMEGFNEYFIIPEEKKLNGS